MILAMIPIPDRNSFYSSCLLLRGDVEVSSVGRVAPDEDGDVSVGVRLD